MANEGLCQKVIKVKQRKDVRKYSNPARGTIAWKNKYKKRSSVERVNAYLKNNYQYNQTKYYLPDHVQVEHQFIQLAYNLKTYATQRLLNKRIEKATAV